VGSLFLSKKMEEEWDWFDDWNIVPIDEFGEDD